MFIAIYRFQAKPGQVQSFIEAWKDLTELIYQHCGSLGSRLHREDELNFIAYAQWPDRDTWKHPKPLPATADAIRQQMRESCSLIETLHELEV
ncbi:MAG: antibiotic biosynthesis monooxygenase, partial [Phaeodactylibacter sp.]|nr:antibiotic biosynthesis monooxygenase [Phaeodactylibacter sp.]